MDAVQARLMASELADAGMWAQTYVAGMARAARVWYRTRSKLADPKLADHPGRPAAVRKLREQEASCASIFQTIVMHECTYDKVWKELTTDQRRHAYAAYHWKTEPEAETLIGASWFGIGASEAWPMWFTLDSRWFDEGNARAAGTFTWDDVDAENEAAVPIVPRWMQDLYRDHQIIRRWQPWQTPPNPFGDDE